MSRPPGAQWTRFRGPNGSGVDTASGYPSEFSASKNLLWKTAAPYGQSSPVISGNHLYYTSSDGNQLLTVCVDAKTGRELWRRGVQKDRTAKIFKSNDPASPTPAADENGVVAFFPDFGLVAFTPQGEKRWSHPMGPFRNFYGMAASPILAGDLMLLLCDQQTGSFLLALDGRPESSGGERKDPA